MLNENILIKIFFQSKNGCNKGKYLFLFKLLNILQLENLDDVPF
jgi:hypothetical protein